MQQPVLVRADQRVAPVRSATVQCEQDASLVALVLFPPPGVSNRLVGVAVGQMIEIMVINFDREVVPVSAGGQSTRHGPGPEHAVVFQAQIEVRPWFAMVVQHERRSIGCLIRHDTTVFLALKGVSPSNTASVGTRRDISAGRGSGCVVSIRASFLGPTRPAGPRRTVVSEMP